MKTIAKWPSGQVAKWPKEQPGRTARPKARKGLLFARFSGWKGLAGLWILLIVCSAGWDCPSLRLGLPDWTGQSSRLGSGSWASGLSWALSPRNSQAETTSEEKRELYLRGQEEWGEYCANCHNATPASDRTPYEWDTIMLHMRVRANIPPEHARALVEYLRTH